LERRQNQKKQDRLQKKVTPSTQGDEDLAYTVVEKIAEFRGGQEALRKYMEKAVSYTDEARKAKVEGSVYVNFIVEKDGKVSQCKGFAWIRQCPG
jgi:outer membrane biosynthesis protein TonB